MKFTVEVIMSIGTKKKLPYPITSTEPHEVGQIYRKETSWGKDN